MRARTRDWTLRLALRHGLARSSCNSVRDCRARVGVKGPPWRRSALLLHLIFSAERLRPMRGNSRIEGTRPVRSGLPPPPSRLPNLDREETRAGFPYSFRAFAEYGAIRDARDVRTAPHYRSRSRLPISGGSGCADGFPVGVPFTLQWPPTAVCEALYGPTPLEYGGSGRALPVPRSASFSDQYSPKFAFRRSPKEHQTGWLCHLLPRQRHRPTV